MNKVEERARAFYLPIVMVLGNPDGLFQEECFARDCKIKGFVEGYKQALKDIWHNVKDEKPELRRTVICVNELMVEAELYTDDCELDEIEHYTKWCYLDDILPNE